MNLPATKLATWAI